MAFRVIADDLTGACDVGAELAAAGHAVSVLVDPEHADDGAVRLSVLNTQSRTLDAAAAHARVLAAVRRRPATVLLKKIDTALRGHLGAELAAVVEGLEGAPVFVLPAIPAAGRVTRGGCQWLDGRPLAATEFARDPEGAGAESSIPAVLARESARPSGVISVDDVRGNRLLQRTETLRRQGADFFVVDAETDADVSGAVAAILELPRPLCVAGSVALARALAARPDLHLASSTPPRNDALSLPTPALVVSGSLHSRAREQIEALENAGRATVIVAAPGAAGDGEVVAARAGAELGAARNVILVPPRPDAPPSPAALRAAEGFLGEVVARIARAGTMASLILIGGETSYQILRRLGASEIVVYGRPAPLLAIGEVVGGDVAGIRVLTKGGSGGAPDALVRLLRDRVPARAADGRG